MNEPCQHYLRIDFEDEAAKEEAKTALEQGADLLMYKDGTGLHLEIIAGSEPAPDDETRVRLAGSLD